MNGVTFLTAIISSSIAQWAAQDFEALPDNVPLTPFSYSAQSGQVYLSLDLILDPSSEIPDAAWDNLEEYPDGTIFVLDSPTSFRVKLNPGHIYPLPTT